ncbi:MAG: MATE family efflux transporter, partial [Thermoguttaceae bacterium]
MKETEEQEVQTGWWTRPCGGFDILRLAIPLIISAGSISLMNFTDRTFLMWYSENAMTASFQAGLLFWTLISLPMHTSAFTNTFVSQYFGVGKYHRIGPVVWQGIWFGLIVMPFMILSTPLYDRIFIYFKHAPELLPLENSYLRIVIFGSGAVIAGEAVASFFYGRGKMQVVMYVNIVSVLLNIVLDYGMIFGKFGMPAWGLEGAAAATTISQWFRFLLFVWIMIITDRKEKRFAVVSGVKPNFKLLGRLLYFGVGSAVHVSLDTACFTLFILLIGGLGPIAA